MSDIATITPEDRIFHVDWLRVLGPGYFRKHWLPDPPIDPVLRGRLPAAVLAELNLVTLRAQGEILQRAGALYQDAANILARGARAEDGVAESWSANGSERSAGAGQPTTA